MQRITSNFDAIDVDEKNALTPEELAPGIVVMLAGMQGGGEATQATQEQVLDLINAFDQNGDGVIDRPEFFWLIE